MTRETRTGLILGMVALLILLIANVYQLAIGRNQLAQVLASQKGSDEQIAKINAQLDSLATNTRRLAEGGNANAAKVVNVLAQNGISIKSNAAGK